MTRERGMQKLATIMAMAEIANEMTRVDLPKSNKPIPYNKTPLTKKQLKARRKSKLAKQSRKQNR